MAQEVNSQTSHHDWEDETVFAINKEDGRATMLLYANEAEMKADEASRKPWLPVHSSLRMMLSGTWQFHWSPSPDDAYEDLARAIAYICDFSMYQKCFNPLH